MVYGSSFRNTGVACDCNTSNHLLLVETVSVTSSPVSIPVSLTPPDLVTVSQEHFTDTMKHNEPLHPFAAEPFEGDLIVSEGKQLPGLAVFGYM
jgi:hypothetical protein